MADDIETPAHAVIAAAPAPGFDGRIEVRRYAPMIVAEVTVAADSRRAASSAGFRPLASYIFGANAPGQKIAMTAPVAVTPADAGGMAGGGGAKIAMTSPVTTAPGGDGEWTVRFMMPSEWTMDTLPAPEDPRVRLVETAPETRATLRFVGRATPERVEAAVAALDSYIAGAGLAPAGDVTWAGYDGPSVPEAERRWEVQRPVEG
ncbi:heme-binding protein [Jannaschia sp. Os4]|nr:heme-binding protein [Jannaschia sp. Os4]